MPIVAATTNALSNDDDEGCGGGCIGGIIGGCFVPSLMFILWMGNVFEKHGCPSPMKKKTTEVEVQDVELKPSQESTTTTDTESKA